MCDAFCKWLPRQAYDFLVGFVAHFGVPKEPIEIRQPIRFIHVGRLDQKSENPPTEEK